MRFPDLGQRFLRRSRLAAGLALVLAASAAPAAETAQTVLHPDLSIEGSALVLRLADGRVLRGTQLEGAIVHLSRGGGKVTSFRLERIAPDPNDPDLLRYDYRVQDAAGAWVGACQPNVQGETWGTAMALPVGHPGRMGPITMACVSDAVGKCARWGYKPWAAGPHGENLVPYHAACVHLVTADYGGNSVPHTRNGTHIDIWDDIGIQASGSRDNPEYAFEAGWTPRGAVCVAKTRWSDLESMDQLAADFPQLPTAAACSEASGREGGALLYNGSLIVPKL